jgi:hypothetical protein
LLLFFVTILLALEEEDELSAVEDVSPDNDGVVV